MKLDLVRIDTTDHGIFGHMTCDSDPFECVTLERHDISIPTGTYKVTLYQSPVHGLVPLLQNVPGRGFIEIHEGNWEHDSKGCILVGADRDALDPTMIDTSKDTLKKLMTVLTAKKYDDISIIVR